MPISPLARLDLLKIDVEAMELQLLRGAARIIERFRPVMYVENDRPQSSQALLRHLAKLRYRLFWSVEPYFDPDFTNFNRVAPERNPFGNRFAYNVLALPEERASQYKVAMPEIEVGTDAQAAREGARYTDDPSTHPLTRPEMTLRMLAGLALSERRVYSQNGEDGVLQTLYQILGTTNRFYVEFGSGEDGKEYGLARGHPEV